MLSAGLRGPRGTAVEITLNLVDEVVALARACAVRPSSTLDELIEGQLRQVAERIALMEAPAQWTREHAGRSEPGWRFNREEIYDRPILK